MKNMLGLEQYLGDLALFLKRVREELMGIAGT